MLVFDTITYAQKLKKVGFTEEQLELQIDLLRTLIENELATKQDSANVQIDIAGLRKEAQKLSNTSVKKPNWVNHKSLQIEREILPNPKRTP